MTPRILFPLLLFALISGWSLAQPVVKTIDKRTYSEESSYFLCFVGKPIKLTKGSPGHAFVVYGVEDAQKRMSTAEAWGQYPATKIAIGTVPGGIVNEAMRGNTGNGLSRLIVKVNSPDYRKAQAILARWKRKDTYKLLHCRRSMGARWTRKHSARARLPHRR